MISEPAQDITGKVRVVTCFQKGPKRRNRKYGYVMEFQGKKEPITRTQIFQEETTENEAALKSVVHAVERFNGKPCKVEIYTDSRWFYNSATIWIRKWSECFMEAEIKYKDLWAKYALFRKQYGPEIHLNEKTEYTNWLEREINEKQKNKENRHNQKG